jgi:hypothetical protein
LLKYDNPRIATFKFSPYPRYQAEADSLIKKILQFLKFFSSKKQTGGSGVEFGYGE